MQKNDKKIYKNEKKNTEILESIKKDDFEELNLPKTKEIYTVSPGEIRYFKKIINNYLIFQKRKYIFFSMNCCFLVNFKLNFKKISTLFCLFCPINIESEVNVLSLRRKINSEQYETTSMKIYFGIMFLCLIHLCKILTNVLGFFGIYQKSKKVLIIYFLFGIVTLSLRGIVTIYIFANYSDYSKIVIAEKAQIQFIFLLIFTFIDFIFGFLCFWQFKIARIEYLSIVLI